MKKDIKQLPNLTATELLDQAFNLDRKGKEAEAIEYYRLALKAGGLSDAQLHGALIGISSSYRNVGKFNLSVKYISQALKLYPNDPRIILFASLSYHSVAKPHLATKLLANYLMEQEKTAIGGYIKPLKYYFRRLKNTGV